MLAARLRGISFTGLPFGLQSWLGENMVLAALSLEGREEALRASMRLWLDAAADVRVSKEWRGKAMDNVDGLLVDLNRVREYDVWAFLSLARGRRGGKDDKDLMRQIKNASALFRTLDSSGAAGRIQAYFNAVHKHFDDRGKDQQDG
jgi:hypothetical protein